MAAHNEFGKWGEDIAERHLKQKGYVIVERDWHLEHRDVDIIALTPDSRGIVFVEVKTRNNDFLVDPIEAVTPKKMRNIGYCANAYIKMRNIILEPRFDVITIVGKGPSDAQITHIEDAFNPCLL